jgi:hypothetical protein
MAERLRPGRGAGRVYGRAAGPQPAAGWLRLRHCRPGGGMRQRFSIPLELPRHIFPISHRLP